MQIEQTAFDKLNELLLNQQLAVLATQMQERPYTSLVAFSASEDLREIVFVTSRATSKYRNLSANPNVSVLIDSRTHSVEDYSTGTAATVVGTATEIIEDEVDAAAMRFIEKYPHLEGFVKSPTTAICRIQVEKYYIVMRFQHVVELDVTQWTS